MAAKRFQPLQQDDENDAGLDLSISKRGLIAHLKIKGPKWWMLLATAATGLLAGAYKLGELVKQWLQ